MRGRGGEKNIRWCAKLKRCGGVEEKEERRRHPCVLHLIRPAIEGYKLQESE